VQFSDLKPSLKRPAGHSSHSNCVALRFDERPGGQSTHNSWFGDAVNVPGAHSPHALARGNAEAVPTAHSKQRVALYDGPYSPGWQSAHSSVPFDAAKRPMSHCTHADCAIADA
jgi:hypothetical protein